jgi:stage II sporulation protein R
MNKAILSVVVAFIILMGSYTEDINRGLSDNLIRLHVVASSDSPEDQSLKKNVRDAVLAYMEQELDGSKDVEESKAIISNRIDDIKAVAQKEIASQGRDEEVQVMLGKYPFPTKAYGDIMLPAGNYQALRVVIGNGTGENWWCVLFPPLCFVDVTHGVVPDSVKEDLKQVLSEEEYDIVTSASEESDIPVKIKFKIVELLQDSRVRFASVISKIFKSQ